MNITDTHEEDEHFADEEPLPEDLPDSDSILVQIKEIIEDGGGEYSCQDRPAQASRGMPAKLQEG